MKLGFEEPQTPYTSGSQSARAWTERWVRDWVFCPSCGSAKINQFESNRPVADFFCPSCSEEYELKSQKTRFGNKVLDGAFSTKCDRLIANNNPNLFLMNYDLKQLSVVNLQNISLCSKLLRNGNRWHRLHDVLVGSVLTSYSIKFPPQEKFSLFETDKLN